MQIIVFDPFYKTLFNNTWHPEIINDTIVHGWHITINRSNGVFSSNGDWYFQNKDIVDMSYSLESG